MENIPSIILREFIGNNISRYKTKQELINILNEKNVIKINTQQQNNETDILSEIKDIQEIYKEDEYEIMTSNKSENRKLFEFNCEKYLEIVADELNFICQNTYIDLSIKNKVIQIMKTMLKYDIDFDQYDDIINKITREIQEIKNPEKDIFFELIYDNFAEFID